MPEHVDGQPYRSLPVPLRRLRMAQPRLLVTPGLDPGPIVLQSVVPLRPDDDAIALAQRVLATEHVIYPRAVRWFVEGALRVEGAVVTHTGGEAQLLL